MTKNDDKVARLRSGKHGSLVLTGRNRQPNKKGDNMQSGLSNQFGVSAWSIIPRLHVADLGIAELQLDSLSRDDAQERQLLSGKLVTLRKLFTDGLCDRSQSLSERKTSHDVDDIHLHHSFSSCLTQLYIVTQGYKHPIQNGAMATMEHRGSGIYWIYVLHNCFCIHLPLNFFRSNGSQKILGAPEIIMYLSISGLTVRYVNKVC